MRRVLIVFVLGFVVNLNGANWSSITPLVYAEPRKTYYPSEHPSLQSHYKTAVWIEVDISDFNKGESGKKLYILNGNYMTKLDENTFEKKGFGTVSSPYDKVYQRVVINRPLVTITTVLANGDTEKQEYMMGAPVMHSEK